MHDPPQGIAQPAAATAATGAATATTYAAPCCCLLCVPTAYLVNVETQLRSRAVSRQPLARRTAGEGVGGWGGGVVYLKKG